MIISPCRWEIYYVACNERMAMVWMLESIPLVHAMIANDSSDVAMRRYVDVDERQMDDIDGG